MSYKKVGWEDNPSSNTPILSVSLNQMDDGIEKANKGIVFGYSATFTADNALKNTTSTEILGPGSFATSQTDIVTVFVADNVTKINNGAFSNCTSLKTIYIDNTVGNVDIVSGAVPAGVSIVYSDDDNFLSVNELLASAIKSLKSSVNANRTDWENRATSIETQHKTDVTELSQTIQKVKESALEEFASVKADVSTNEKSIESLKADFNKSVDEINTTLDTKENVSNKVSVITHPSLDYYPDTKAVFDYVNSKLETPLSDIENLKADKLDKTAFNSYKTATDKAIKDNTDNINLLDTNKANLVQSKNLFDMKSYLDMLSNNQKPIINGVLNNVDKSNNIFTFTTTGPDCYTSFWYGSNVFKIPVDKETTYTMSWDFNGSDGNVFVFLNGKAIKGDMVQTKASKKKLTFTTKDDTTYVTFRFGIDDSGTSATIGDIQIEKGTESTTYLPNVVSKGVNEVDKAVNTLLNRIDELATALVAHESEVM